MLIGGSIFITTLAWLSVWMTRKNKLLAATSGAVDVFDIAKEII